MSEAGLSDIAGGYGRSLTTFVGRQVEAARLVSLLTLHRLVTITGPGGVGKTRLAAEVTRAPQLPAFPDGVRFVDLAAIRDGAQVPWAVAATLGVQDDSTRAITSALAAVLSGEQSLLVLDNCEQVLVPVAQLCQTLLSYTDELRILATSREPVGVAGEAQLRLAPLTTETPDPASGEADAVALFLDRVRLRQPGLVQTPHVTRQSVEIVARLDGLPLAIELAAARVESLGMGELLRRLDEPFRILATSAGTTTPRHRSLHATAEWSYQLLREPSRRVFRRLAVLPSPFTLDTALALAGPGTESDVLALVDASMLTPPDEAPDGRARYLMLDSLRAYGRAQLAMSGELDDAVSARNAQALQLGQSAAAVMRDPEGEASAVAWLDAESALLHRALLSDLDRGEARALRLAVALAPWWRLRGLRSMGYPMLSRAADQSSDGRRADWRAAQLGLGRLALGNSAWQMAEHHFTAVIGCTAPARRSTERADALVGRSAAWRNLDHVDRAVADAERARELAHAMSYAECEALAVAQLTLAASYAGDADAVPHWEDQLHAVDASRLPGESARQLAVAHALALIDIDRPERAALICVRGLDSARAVADIAVQADLLYLAASAAVRIDDLATAGRHLHESLVLTARSGHRARVLDCLDICAHLCAASNQWVDAVTCWAARAEQTTTLGMADRVHEAHQRQAMLESAQHRLAASALFDAERRGASMTFHAAVEFATVAVAPGSPQRGTSVTEVRLSTREQELLALVAQGKTDAQIAEALFISIRTVRSHLDRIRDKTGSRRRADLTRLALQRGLV